MKSDPAFLHLLKLFTHGKGSAEIRKRIIKSIKAPISEPALAFMGKRLRDVNDDVVCLVFKQLLQCDVRLEDFANNESRMLVLAEGLQHSNEAVRDACMQLLSKSVMHNTSDLAYVLGLVNCKLAFTN